MITENIPVNLEGLDAANIRRTYNPGGQLEWSSFENTGLSSSGYYITSATLYSDAFVEDQATYNTHLWEVEEGHYHDNIKFTNAPRVTYRKNKTYKFRYVVFPFRYDETVTTWFGTGTVQDLIEDLRAFYPGNPPPFGTLNHVLGDAGLAEGAAYDPITPHQSVLDRAGTRCWHHGAFGCTRFCDTDISNPDHRSARVIKFFL